MNTLHHISIYLLLLIFTAGSVAAQKSNDTIVYQRGELTLKLLPDNTYQFFVEPCDICPRLLPNNLQSFGQYYTYKKEAYYLFSDTSLYPEKECKIEESSDDSDNLIFRFHIPKPNYKNLLLRNWLIFNVTLYLEPDTAEWEYIKLNYIPNDTNIRAFYTDDTLLIIPKPAKSICYFRVNVFTNSRDADIPRFSVQNNIVAKNSSSNIFDIYMPMVTPEFFLYERFLGEPVKIIDKNAVLFKRWVLLKKGVFQPIQYTDYAPLPKKYWKYVNGGIDAGLWRIKSTYPDEDKE